MLSGNRLSRFGSATILLTSMVCLALFVGCTKWSMSGSMGSNEDSNRLVLSGSSTVGPLVSEIAKRYEKFNPAIRIDVQTGGSSRGITEVASGLADIGMSSRSLKKSEQVGRVEWAIAMDGVCFIVHASNNVGQISQSQLAEILRGEIDNWKDLGGDDAPIVFINRAAGRSELELISKFFGIAPAEMKADLVAGENQQGIKNVAGTPNSISYMSVGASEEAIRRNATIRMLPLDGIEATVANVESGKFPLSRPLILVTNSEPTKEAKKFIQYAQSKEVADLVRELSYVPILN